MTSKNTKYGKTRGGNLWELGILLMAIHVLPLCIGQSTDPQAAGQVPQTQPTTESGVSQPTTASNVSQPTTESDVSQPTTESNVSQPMIASNVSQLQPATESNVSQPMTASNVSQLQPATESNVSQPTTASNVSQLQPTSASNVSQSQPEAASTVLESQPKTESIELKTQPATANKVSQPSKSCGFDSCTLIASRIVENMDDSVDPCNNFYEFACGGFIQSIDIPDGQQSISNKDVLLLELNERIKSMIAAEVEPEDPQPFQILKKFYELCMSRSVSNRQKTEELKNYLKERGGWPALEGETWKDTYFNWKQKLKKFRADGDYLGDFIGLRIDKDPKDESSRIITLFQPPGFFGPGTNETAFNVSWVQVYHQTLVNITVALGANETYASVELKEALLFEMKLANIKLNDEEIAKLNSSNRMTIRQLNRRYPSVPWIENIKTILSSPDFDISEDESINVPVPEYYVKLEKLIAETLPRVRANYVMSKIVLRNGIYSSEKIRGIIYRFFTELLGNVKPLDEVREKFCSSHVVANFWLVFSIMFVKKYLPTGAENRVNQIRNSVKEEFIKMVNQINYHDDESPISTLKIADTIQNISYPSEQDIINLGKYYENLVVNESSFFGSMNELSIFDTTLLVRELRNPALKNDSTLSFEETSINPTLLTQQKYIRIPEKLIQILYVSDQGSSYIGFSTIATAAGRNIIDALYAKDDTEKPFNCEECVVEKYENYSTGNEGFKLNGNRTMKENRADLGRLRLAYNAYNTWTAIQNDSLKLPGLENYSAKQMFWLSTASNICTKYTKVAMDYEINNSSQVPAEFQVNIAFANMPEFGNDFKCNRLSPMRAKNSCCIW